MRRKLSATYWDIYSIFYDKLYDFPSYNDMITEVYNFLNVNEKGIYLDAGCGTGALVKKISEKCERVYGIDCSSFMLKLAQKKSKTDKVTFLQGDITKPLPFNNEFFDGIACIHVINYCENLPYVISELNRVLKKDGRLALVFLEKLNFKSNIHSYKQFLINEKIKSLKSLVPLLVVGIMNTPMRMRYGTSFYSSEEIKDILVENKLSPIVEKKVYADQSVFLGCKK